MRKHMLHCLGQQTPFSSLRGCCCTQESSMDIDDVRYGSKTLHDSSMASRVGPIRPAGLVGYSLVVRLGSRAEVLLRTTCRPGCNRPSDGDPQPADFDPRVKNANKLQQLPNTPSGALVGPWSALTSVFANSTVFVFAEKLNVLMLAPAYPVFPSGLGSSYQRAALA